MTDLNPLLIALLSAPAPDEVSRLALETLIQLTQSHRTALLLWDDELQRYIVGGIFPSDSAVWRREALRDAMDVHPHRMRDQMHAVPSTGLHYYPLYTQQGILVGAWLYDEPALTVDLPALGVCAHAAAHALWTITRLERAEREHAQLNTERKRLETLLHAVDQQQRTIDRLLTREREFSASLETQIEERTAALREAQARILHSEKLAVIGTLAASLAHEINNPLQAIQSGLGLVLAELSQGEIEQACHDLLLIQSELERIQSIFRQMLDFNQAATRTRAPIDLNALCAGVRVLVRKRMDEAHITLNLDLAETLPAPCGDRSQIKQVLLNLILNSAEAVPKKGGFIHISTAYEHPYVQLAVHDNGSGIPPGHQARLFEPFFTTRTRGLGLGLAICKQIIDAHDGIIHVRSTPETGTTFTVYLPVESKGNCHDSPSTTAGR